MKKKILLLLLIVLGLTTFIGCKNEGIINQWNENSITIDGDDSDWENASLTISEDINAAFGTANDNENFYLMLRLNDYRMARRIKMMGLTVWINSEGKKKKKFGIRYTGSESFSRKSQSKMGSDEQMGKTSRFAKMREKMKAVLPDPGMIALIRNEEISFQIANNPLGPSASSTEKNSYFCYELKIPLTFDKSPTDNQPEAVGEKIKLCLEIGGINDEMRNQMKELIEGGNSGGRGSGMSGGRGGIGSGMRGGGGKGSSSRMAGGQKFEKQEIWLDVILAKQPIKQ